MSFELLIMHEEQLTHLFLTFITCHVDSLMSWLLVVVEMFIELKKFIESKKFKKKEKNEWLYFNASEYLIDLFWKISSNCFICSFHLRHEHLQSSWLSLQFTHCLLSSTQRIFWCDACLHIWSNVLHFCKI